MHDQTNIITVGLKNAFITSAKYKPVTTTE